MEVVRLALDIIGTLALLASGLALFATPAVTAKALHLTLEGPRGRAEFRIACGGTMVGLALVALVLREPASFAMVASVWLGAGLARLAALALDRPALDASYTAFLALELGLGILMLL